MSYFSPHKELLLYTPFEVPSMRRFTPLSPLKLISPMKLFVKLISSASAMMKRFLSSSRPTATIFPPRSLARTFSWPNS